MPKNQVPMWERIVDVKTRGQIREEEMTDAEKKERERLVKGMKKSADDFETRYPGRGKDVMYATATKMAMGETSLSESPGTFTVMAIDDPTPTYKRNDYNYKPSAKVLDQMRVSQDEIMLVAKDLRRKFPKATISVENKGGKIVKVFKPGQMIKEAGDDSDYEAYFRGMLKKHGYDSPADIPDDKKDDFFNAVDKGYSAKNESRRLTEVEQQPLDFEYLATFGFTKKNLVRQYRENEANNLHSDNALFLAMLFGTPQEQQLAAKLKNITRAEGGLDYAKYQPLIQKVNSLHSKYYSKLMALPESRPVAKKMREGVEENDDLGMMKGQLMSIIDRASALLDRVSANPPSDVEAWVQAKTTDADTAITALHDYFTYSDDQNPEFPVEPLAEAELLVKGEKPISGVTLPLKKTAAIAFASAFMDRPTGTTPEAIVNQALAVYFQKNKVPNIVRLRNLGRMLQLVSKMGINWNEELIPPQLVRFVNAAASPTGLPMDEAVEGPASPSSMSATQRLSQQQKQEKEQLAARHQQQKMAAQQRDFQEKQRKSQSPAAR